MSARTMLREAAAEERARFSLAFIESTPVAAMLAVQSIDLDQDPKAVEQRQEALLAADRALQRKYRGQRAW